MFGSSSKILALFASNRVFCDFDIDEVGGSFAFGSMDQVDSFRISEVDLSGRKSANHLKMKLLASYLIGSLNDIHNQLYSECYMDNRQSLLCNDGNCSADGYLSNRRMYQAYPDKRIVNGESSFQGACMAVGQLVSISSCALQKPLPLPNGVQMQVNDTFGGDHVKRITDGLDFEPLDLKYWFILNSRLDGAIILFVMRGKIMDGFSLKLSS